jgi:hypothetical protein
MALAHRSRSSSVPLAASALETERPVRSSSQSAMLSPTRTSLLASIALVAVALSTQAGCKSLVPFTHEIRTEHGLTDDEVKNLQFYVSHGVTLRREIESGGRQVTPGHKLLLVSGKTIEEVFIPAKTPGVAVKVGPRAIAVSFEPGTSLIFTVKSSRLALENDIFLRRITQDSVGSFAEPPRSANLFGQQFAQSPDPFPGNTEGNTSSAVPVGDDSSGNYWLDSDGAGRIAFAGKPWNGEEDSLQAHLLIDSDSLEEVDKKRTVLKGVQLDSK